MGCNPLTPKANKVNIMTIEDIILDNDRRGISHLRPYVPSDFCDRAAQLVLDNPGHSLHRNRLLHP